MPNRRKRILLVSALLVVAVGLTMTLLPRNEPKYQGRYLTEWMEDLTQANPNEVDVAAVRRAVEQIGTNGLPTYVAWLSREPKGWKESLFSNLPLRLKRNRAVAHWLLKEARRPELAMQGIFVLGTNATAAIPALENLMQSRTNEVGHLAIHALAHIGAESVPVLKTAFTNPKQVHRLRILWCLRWLALSGHTNECMPTIIAALNDQDANVRTRATNLVPVTSTGELFNVPKD